MKNGANAKKNATKHDYTFIIVLDMINQSESVDDLRNSIYLKQELGIVSVSSLTRKLISQGYCQRGKGNKLILTKAGKSLLENNEDCVRFFYFGCPHVSIADYQREKKLHSQQATFEEVMLSLAKKKAKSYLSDGDYISAQGMIFDVGCLYEMAELPRHAFYYYIIALLMAAQGMEYVSVLQELKSGKRDKISAINAYTGINIMPKVIEGILRVQQYYDAALVDRALERAALPISLCTGDEFRKLVVDIINGTYNYSKQQNIAVAHYNKLLGF